MTDIFTIRDKVVAFFLSVFLRSWADNVAVERVFLIGDYLTMIAGADFRANIVSGLQLSEWQP